MPDLPVQPVPLYGLAPEERAAHVDSLIRQNRKLVPAAAVEQRKTPRTTIADLNATDADELRDRLINTYRDSRTPFVKALDLLDAPRNVVANLLFNQTGLVNPNKMERGAFGLPKVYASDALDALGVHNHVARAIIGFVGDTALDPLTYAGPAGWGFSVAGKAGEGVQVGARLARGIRAGVKQVAKGGVEAVAHPETRELFATLAENAGREFKDNAELAAHLSEKVHGKAVSGKVGQFFSRVGLHEERRGGSVLADELTAEGQVGDAVRKALAYGGKGSAPGLRFGSAGSTVAHIPFTELGVHVPAFTRAGRSAETVRTLAESGARPSEEVFKTLPWLQKAEALKNVHNSLADRLAEHSRNDAKLQEAFDQAKEAAGTDAAALGDVETRFRQTMHQRDLLRTGIDPRTGERVGLGIEGQLQEARNGFAAHLKTGAPPMSGLTPLELAQVMHRADAAELGAAAVKTAIDSYPDVERIRAFNAGVDRNLDFATEPIDRILEHQNATKGGGVLKEEVVVPGRELPKSMRPDEGYVPPPEIPVLSVRDKRKQIRALKDQIDQLPKRHPLDAPDAHPELDRLQTELALLRSAHSLHDTVAGKLAGTGVDRTPRTFLATDPVSGEAVMNADPVVQQRAFEHSRPILDRMDEALAELKALPTEKAGTGLGHGLFEGRVLSQAEMDAQSKNAFRRRQELIDELYNPQTGLTRQLEEVTAPLRENPTMPFEQYRTGIREHLVNQLGVEADKKLVELADHDVAAAERAADALHRSMGAWNSYAGAVRSSVRNTISEPETVRLAREVGKRALGTSDEIIAGSAMDSMDNVAANAMRGWGRNMREWFGAGLRDTQINDTVRAIQHTRGPSRSASARIVGDEISHALADAMDKSQIERNNETLDQAGSVLLALVYEKRAKEAEAAGLPQIIKTHKTGQPGVPTTMLSMLAKARATGMFSDKAAPGFVAKLEQIADKYGTQILDLLGAAEKEDEILAAGQMRRGYVYSPTTRGAEEAIRRGKRTYGSMPGGRPIAAAQEGFLKEATMHQQNWISQRPGMEGQERQLFMHEMELAKDYMAHPEQIQALADSGRPEIAKQMQELVDDYRELQSLPQKPPVLMTDPWEQLELAADGRFSYLLDGGVPLDGFKKTNLIDVIASRTASHEVEVARHMFEKMTSLPAIVAKDFRGKPVGDTIVADDGTRIKIVERPGRNGPRERFAMIGGQAYRPLLGSVVNAPLNPMLDFIGAKASDQLFHENWADAIEGVSSVFQSEESAKKFLDAVDAITRHWKSLTLLHPSWTIKNVIGDTFNLVSQGIDVGRFLKYIPFAIKQTKFEDSPETLAKLFADVRGVRVSADQILHDTVNVHKVREGTFTGEDARHWFDSGHVTFASSGESGVRGIGQRLKSDYLASLAKYVASKKNKTPGFPDKLKAGAFVANDRYIRSFLGPWYRANQKIGNVMRTAAYMAFLDAGNDGVNAARKTINGLFDYSSMTKTENAVFRRMFPFWAWMKNNGALQVRTLFEHPAFAASFPRVRNAIEEMLAGEQRVPMSQRPGWMQNALAMQVGGNPDSQSAVLLAGAVPQGDLFQYLAGTMGVAGAQDFLHTFVSGLNPAFSTAYAIGAKTDPFSGRSIGPDPYSADMTVGQYVRGQVRPLAELGPEGKVYKAFGRSVKEGIGRLALGGSLQDFSAPRLRQQKLREYTDQIAGIRHAFSRYEAAGDHEGSLRARVRLLSLYSEMLSNGFDEGVPPWAKKQLPTLQGAGT